ncbi:MAG: SMC-Scp complex subunit ScpB [Mariniblastus sp.]
MSRKPSKKSERTEPDVEDPTQQPDDDIAEIDLEGDEDENDDEDMEDEEEDGDAESEVDEDDEDDEDDEEGFSLDQLSQAYAQVLKEKGGGEVIVSEESSEEPLPRDESPTEEEVTESDDDAACPISPESIIESILFVGTPKDVKLNSRKVAAVLRDVSPKEVTKIVRSLNAKYEKENAAYRVESDGGVFKMVLDPKLLDFQQEFFGRNRHARLSQSAIDVMAVVAYNQPTTKAQIEKTLPRPCGSVLAQLVRRELLHVEPGSTDPKVKYYSTTERFLDLFGLDGIADLPQTHDVSDIEELAD